MAVDKVYHMNRGDGENSYSRNSSLQEKVILRVRPILEDAIKTRYCSTLPHCFHLADFGCSSGNNTFTSVSGIIDTVVDLFRRKKVPIPEFQVSLNDLPGNDFNSISASLPNFYSELRNDRGVNSCFVSCVPGSFYGRLFPAKTIHLVHSSYCLHWISKVPDGIIDINKGNICIGKTSPPNVFEAYLRRFQADFTTFLSCRADEVVAGGHMILTFQGRSTAQPARKECFLMLELLSQSLLDMAKEGIINEKDVDSFNVPMYTPDSEEVRDVITKEGSFNLDKLEIFKTNWDPDIDEEDDDHRIISGDNATTLRFDAERSSHRVAQIIRAISEPMVETHFGSAMVEELFSRFANHVAEALEVDKKYVNFVVFLTKLT